MLIVEIVKLAIVHGLKKERYVQIYTSQNMWIEELKAFPKLYVS